MIDRYISKMCDNDKPWFENYYYCTDCDEEWTDYWSATCDDECPSCGIAHQPHKSRDCDPDTEEYLINQ